MASYLIVSRHAAAVQFIRETAPEFVDAPVIAAATAADVRDKIVAGNLPLHLASLATQIVAVEFTGDPPRGAEYGLAEMRDAGARLARYVVSGVAEPAREISYSNGIRSRGRQSKLLCGNAEQAHEFVGSAILGIVAIVKGDYTKDGKWSRTDYTLRLAPTAWAVEISQSWEEGQYFHDCNSMADARATLRQKGCMCRDEVLSGLLRSVLPKTCERLDAREQEIKSVS